MQGLFSSSADLAGLGFYRTQPGLLSPRKAVLPVHWRTDLLCAELQVLCQQ